ncbi:hypothetical protein SAZ10_06215 [Mesorhizobium sp. BAC0120]|uniref:hypothetical protein n=1 Tax=Mesorhizobium sp. BAC0120 TaxID=3090670 RepID=UPI00298C68A2|nr:hypothetical protein [Mesorhizobium sp. BAC0120]MDW6021357.1 hypothetical protein [Mesorhizobium sp. BAC0120]
MHALEVALIANLASKTQREPTPRRKELVPYEPVSRRSIFVAAIAAIALSFSLAVLTSDPVATANRTAAMADLANDSD